MKLGAWRGIKRREELGRRYGDGGAASLKTTVMYVEATVACIACVESL